MGDSVAPLYQGKWLGVGGFCGCYSRYPGPETMLYVLHTQLFLNLILDNDIFQRTDGKYLNNNLNPYNV